MLSKQQYRIVLAIIGFILIVSLPSCKSRNVALNKHSATSQSTTKITDKSIDSLSSFKSDKTVTLFTKTDSTQTYETDSLEVKADSIWVDKAGYITAKGNAIVKRKSTKQTAVNTTEINQEIKDIIEDLEYKREANIEAVQEAKVTEKEVVKETSSKPSLLMILIPIIIIALMAFIAVRWNWLKKVFN